MVPLQNKIDFAVIICVHDANPNGDPLNGNRPRTNYDGRGEISDVCLKRKIRNRLMNAGCSVFVQSDGNRVDSFPSLRARAEGMLKNVIIKDVKDYEDTANALWIDVRTFGQVFAYKGSRKGDGVSIGIRGPVSIHPAFSVAPVLDRVSSIQITKSVSGEGDGSKKASDTMGMKHRVDHGVYVFYGSMNPQLATKTGFSDVDAQMIKDALLTLFEGDDSSARPGGSMEVYKVFWWQHTSPIGQYSSAKVHRSVSSKIRVKEGIGEPNCINDYEIPDKFEIEQELPGLVCEIIDGK
jgi:CRISPR-associated protein Csd2